MKIQTFLYKMIGPEQVVRPSITERGFVYGLYAARVFGGSRVHACYKLRCR